MEILDNFNELGNKLMNKIDLKGIQEKFLNSNIGQIANNAIDFSLRAVLPDFIENDVIEVKDALVTGGLKEGINTAIQNAVELGRKILGIETDEFTSIEQAEETIQRGDVIEGISNCLDNILDKLSVKNVLSDNIVGLIKEGKETILNNISNDVSNEFENEIKALEKIEKYIGNWEKYYSEKNIDGLTKEYNKIEKQMKKIMPLENIIKNVNKIQNINELIKNTDNFDFSEVYLDLAENL